MKDPEYRIIRIRIPRNSKPWPNATFGTIREFLISGLIIGFISGFLLSTILWVTGVIHN